MAAEDAGAAALEQGYLGNVPDQIENEAYTVSADHADTAQRVLDQREQRRAEEIAASRFTEPPPKAAPKAKSTSSSSSS